MERVILKVRVLFCKIDYLLIEKIGDLIFYGICNFD